MASWPLPGHFIMIPARSPRCFPWGVPEHIPAMQAQLAPGIAGPFLAALRAESPRFGAVVAGGAVKFATCERIRARHETRVSERAF
jgi:hypothetical protein